MDWHAIKINQSVAQLAGAVKYIDYFSAEG